MGILLSGIFERIARVNLKQTLKADYVEAARARGIPESTILFSHAFKNALIPTITVLGLTFAALLGGAVLTEVTFSSPGDWAIVSMKRSSARLSYRSRNYGLFWDYCGYCQYCDRCD